MTGRLWFLLAFACGGKAAVPTAPAVPPVRSAALDPACPPAGKVELAADGHLRCRELPFELAFPPGTKLARSNEQNMALFNAELERGVMALVAEPRTDSPDAARITQLLTSLVKGIALDATITPAAAPALDAATASAALAFTTPDGGAGLVRGYFAHHWLFAVVVGGRLANAPTRPETPAAKSFLASLRTRPLATGTVRHVLANGAHVEIPANAWSAGTVPAQPGVRSESLLVVPDRALWVGVRELEPGEALPNSKVDRCDYIRDAGDQLDERLKAVYAGAQFPLQHIARVSFGDVAVYADAKASDRSVLLYFICAGKTVVQLSVVGEQPIDQLRPQLDELARSLVGAK